MSLHSFDFIHTEDDETLLVKWTLKNFLSITEDKIESQLFSHDLSNVKRRLCLFPKLMRNGEECVKIKLSHELKINVQLKMAFTIEQSSASISRRNIPATHLYTVQPPGIFYCIEKPGVISHHLKTDGSLVVVRMDYTSIVIDQTWVMNRVN